MRNLSKVLALVLSLAFVLTMFAGAIDTTIKDYVDKAELSAAGSEAVAVLSALGIVDGFPDGEFKPAENVTRAQFAKMLSVADYGTDVKGSFATTAIGEFTDQIDAWALPYLNYAYLTAIMVGYGDNTIRPMNNVTGFEAVKMTLVALGYDPKVEGLEGSAWQNNTARLAVKIGLLKNLENKDLYGAFDREATAILVRNAIYTETVNYVGTSAVGSGKTLGEDVFDLIDVRAIVVGNDQDSIGLNWVDVLKNNNNYNSNAYIAYNKTSKGQTRFAYRDYSEANEKGATVGGFYVPRELTIAVESNKSDLGKAFRILATGAKNPANTNEVRKIYGILGPVSSDESYTLKENTGADTKIVDAMLASAQEVNKDITADSVQGNIFLNGKAVSYADAKAAIGLINTSTAPYYMVDNDGDGIYDFLYLYTLTAAKVLAVKDGGKLTLAGIGDVTPANGIEGIEVGDYVAYWSDGQFANVKELETYVGKVTAYTLNSGSNPLTYNGGKYTINGTDYTFGALANAMTADERTYFEQLLGIGSAAVADATLKFVFDGKYIVTVSVTDETHWENYAIMIAALNDRYLGMAHVRLLTEDNEYKDFYVASFNGQQIYNTIVNWYPTFTDMTNQLVRYEEIGNNQIALYGADYLNASSVYTNTVAMYFDQTTGMWEGHEYPNPAIQNGTLYNWKNGVVFVTYGMPLRAAVYGDNDNNPANVLNPTVANNRAYQWRAYLFGEFQPAYASEATPLDKKLALRRGAYGDEVVYATALNGVRTLKAAAISFDYTSFDPETYTFEADYILPGLPLRAGQAIWGTVMSTTNIASIVDEQDAKTKYAFQVKILKPWNGGTETITVYSDVRLATFITGNIYKMFIDSDGVCRRWELAASARDTYDVLGTDYLELGRYVITGILPNGDGSYYFIAKKGIPGTNDFYAENVKLYVPKDAALYFVEKLFTKDIKEANEIKKYGSLDYLSQSNHLGVVAYFDINPTTMEVRSGWIDFAVKANYSMKATIKVEYNTNTKEATYTVDPSVGAIFAGDKTSVTVKCEPWELKAPVGDAVIVNLALTYDAKGAWYIDGVDAISGYTWVKYDKSNASAVKYTAGDKLEIQTPGFSMMNIPKTFNLDKIKTIATDKSVFGADLTTDGDVKETEAFWVRTGTYNDVAPIYGDQQILWKTTGNPYFYKAGPAGEGFFAATQWDQKYAYNPDGFKDTTTYFDAYNYESFWVMYNNEVNGENNTATEKTADACVIVYVEENGTVTALENSGIVYPYIP